MAEFVTRLGFATYPALWPAIAAGAIGAEHHLQPKPYASNADLVWDVREDLRRALIAGVVTAKVQVPVSRLTVHSEIVGLLPSSTNQPPNFHPTNQQSDEQFDPSQVLLATFFVENTHWVCEHNFGNIDWKASKCIIPHEALYQIEVHETKKRIKLPANRNNRPGASQTATIGRSTETRVPLFDVFAPYEHSGALFISIHDAERALGSKPNQRVEAGALF